MRKIEVELITAIANNKQWKNSNTETIKTRDFDGTNVLEVRLHGNKIAEIRRGSSYDTLVLFWSDSRYFSRTTFSRQNAILSQFVGPGVGLFTKDRTPFLQRRFNLGPLDLTQTDRFSFSLNN